MEITFTEVGALPWTLQFFTHVRNGSYANGYQPHSLTNAFVIHFLTSTIAEISTYILKQKETSDFHGTVSFDPVKMLKQK